MGVTITISFFNAKFFFTLPFVFRSLLQMTHLLLTCQAPTHLQMTSSSPQVQQMRMMNDLFEESWRHKKNFLAKETFAKTFLISFWFNSVIWCQYKKIFQYCSSCSFLYLLGNPEKALYCNITILQVSNKSFHWTNLIEQHVEDYWYKFMARQSFNSSFTLFVQQSRSTV